MGSSKWKRVSRQHVCPVCGKYDWCMVTDDAVLCMRIESLKPAKNGGWIHPLNDIMASQWQRVPARTVGKHRTHAEMDALWRPIAKRSQEQGRCEIGRLATILGVTVMALRELDTGFDGRAWTFPERDGAGLIIGVTRRFEDGRKRCVTGSRRGLTYSDNWRKGIGPVLIVEGASDVAAGITLGLSVVGRPSNRGGLRLLVTLFREDSNRKLIVIGERDRKPDGSWPGMDGCKSIAAGLGKALRRTVSSRLMPDGAKDLRDYLNRSKNAGLAMEEISDNLRDATR